MVFLYNNGFTERDYYVVGQGICISRPGAVSELEIEETDVKNECLRILRQKGVLVFQSWAEFEAKNGEALVASFRAQHV
jgi:hypothetical protein